MGASTSDRPVITNMEKKLCQLFTTVSRYFRCNNVFYVCVFSKSSK